MVYKLVQRLAVGQKGIRAMVDKLSQDELLAVAQACDDASQLIGRKLFCADERRWYAGEWRG